MVKQRKRKKMNMSDKGRNLWLWCTVVILTAAFTFGSALQQDVFAELTEDEIFVVLEDEGPAEQISNPSADNPSADEAVESPEKEQPPESGEFDEVFYGDSDGDVEEIQSITFKRDMGIRDALRFLAAKYQRNIVPSSNVDGRLAFTSLYDVTFEEAMDAILGNDFRYKQQGNMIRVYTAEEYRRILRNEERMEHRIFTLYHISASEAVQLLSPVLSDAALVQGSSPAQAGISTNEMGVGSEAGGDSMALHDRIVIFDYPENLEKATELLESLDVRPDQVLIEATIMTATLTEETKFGVDWSNLDDVSINSLQNVADGQSGFTQRNFADPTGGLAIGISADSISALFTALEETTDISVLANPKILALNKQVGTVFIGTRQGYREGDRITDGDVRQEGQVRFLDGGTKLSFRPYIGSDGYIRMDIYPKQSEANIDDDGIPFERTSELITNVMVKDGTTIVIGGLFRDSVTTSKSKVPVLGDLPILGGAFRSTKDDSMREEVIVMLTPHIIRSPEDIDAHAVAEDISRKSAGAKEGLTWPGQTKLANKAYEKAAKLYADDQPEEALRELEWALRIRPTYREALKLQERIKIELYGEDAINRKVIESVESGHSDKLGRN